MLVIFFVLFYIFFYYYYHVELKELQEHIDELIPQDICSKSMYENNKNLYLIFNDFFFFEIIILIYIFI